MRIQISDFISRWRHTRGYGVHSPLAYRIVKECIRPDNRYGFYSDAYLDFEFHDDRKGLRNAKLALRIINLLHPKRIWIPAADKRIRTAFEMSFPKLYVASQKECPKNVDFIICHSHNYGRDLWKRMDEAGDCGLLAFTNIDKSQVAEWSNPPTLQLFGKDLTLMLRRKGMESTSYEIL